MNRIFGAAAFAAALFSADFAVAEGSVKMTDSYTASIGLGEKATPLVLVKINAGKFLMGAPENEPAPPADYKGNAYKAHANEKPQHEVTITKDFHLGKYEVTQAQWQLFRPNPSKQHVGDNKPVIFVSRRDALDYIAWLNTNDKSKPAGFDYRLPTEAEWEYACRAGSSTKYFSGDSPASLEDYAWHECNAKGENHDVGTKKSNPWGLHDMCGNVWEMCSDLYGIYNSEPASDPKEGAVKLNEFPTYVIRGSCLGGRETMTSYMRHHVDEIHSGNNMGFRVVLAPSETGKAN